MKALVRERAIATEIMGGLFLSVAEEMGVVLVHAAFSPNFKERRDCSACVFDAHGEVVAQASHVHLHLGSMLGVVEEVVRRYPVENLRPGDMFLANDPYNGGGSHLPDYTVIAPVFSSGELVAFVGTTGHHSDVGGKAVGSQAGDCTDIYQEGVRIPLVKILSEGRLHQEVWEIILLNSRVPHERVGDLRAQFAANRTGVRRLEEICAKYGREQVRESMVTLQDATEQRIRARLRKLPDGVYSARDYLDHDGIGEEAVPIQVTLTVTEGRVKLDFTGTAPCVTGGKNMTMNALRATVYAVLKQLLDPGLPPNGGYYRAIELICPPGTVLNATPPAAVGERALTSTIVGDVVAAALSQAMLERALAPCGSYHGMILSGFDAGKGKFFVDYESFPGGWGARAFRDGTDIAPVYAIGGFNMPVEALEIEYPLRVERYELRPESGGAGRFRGGLGLRRDYRLLSDKLQLTMRVERQRVLARGLCGGKDGSPGCFLSNPGTPEERVLPSNVSGIPLRSGDLLSIRTPGGAGYGDPRTREPELVLRDVVEGKLSEEGAASLYGVVVGEGRIDAAATARARRGAPRANAAGYGEVGGAAPPLALNPRHGEGGRGSDVTDVANRG